MSTYTRQPRGLRTGGQFATSVRSEPTASLTRPISAEGAYRRMTEPGADRVAARSAARRLLESVRSSGQLARMVGTSRIDDVAAVMDAARDDARIDRAIDALAEQERRSPGRTDEKAAGFVLARALIRQHRAAA